VNRVADTGEFLYSFLDQVLVACPRCGACAFSRSLDGNPRWDAPRRLTCPHCAHTQDWDGARFRSDERAALDPHFTLPLWLQAPCCGETLWAYNVGHLDFLASYVGATLRERKPDQYGWSNRSLASRLPAWIKARKHRDEVLRVIARLRDRLPKPGER
jgi:hypothetical protein